MVVSDTWSKHLATLKLVFECTAREGLTLKPVKCEVAFNEVTFLGSGQIEAKPEIIKKVQGVPSLKTKCQVRSFLGLAGFCRDFIPGHVEVADLLTELTRKG